MVNTKHYLPSKLAGYLRRLEVEYLRDGPSQLRAIVAAAKFYIREGRTRWDGYLGHEIVLFIPFELFARISLEKQQQLAERLRDDLNACASAISDENVKSLAIDVADDSDLEFLEARGISGEPQIDPEVLSIWRPGYLRVFITHRDQYKAEARRLANAMEDIRVQVPTKSPFSNQNFKPMH